MTRFPDWRQRLVAYLHVARRKPFSYGRHDCTIFAADAVMAMTGKDHAAAFRGRYSTVAGGLRVLRKAGHADNVEMVASLLPECHPIMAQPGDLAAIDTEDGPALGVVQGEAIYVLSPSGLSLAPITAARRAFRV